MAEASFAQPRAKPDFAKWLIHLVLDSPGGEGKRFMVRLSSPS